jgi:hypothetical protein
LIKDDIVVVVVDFDDFGEYMRYYFAGKNEIDLEMDQGLKDET